MVTVAWIAAFVAVVLFVAGCADSEAPARDLCRDFGATWHASSWNEPAWCEFPTK